MIYYIMLTIATLLFSLQFMFNNGYQKESGSGLSVTLKFTFYTSVIGLILVFFINKGQFEFSWFSLAITLVYSTVLIGLNYCSIKAFETANLSVYSIFSMIGGMLLPFFYGLLTGDELKLTRIICCALITLSVVMTVNKGGSSKKALKYYIGVFILNGMVGVLSSFHLGFAELFGLSTDPAVDSGSFLMLSKIVTAVFSFAWLMLQKDRSLKISLKAGAFCIGSAAFNSIANLLILLALVHLPPSVNYPIITGGVIVFSTIIDKIRRVKVTGKELIAAGIAFVSTIFMAF